VYHPELGRRILERVADEVSEIATIEAAPRQDGRNMTMILNPAKKPTTGRPARAAAASAPPSGAAGGDAPSGA